jgi:hypothetical protein
VFLDGRQATSCQAACASSLLDDFSGLTRNAKLLAIAAVARISG